MKRTYAYGKPNKRPPVVISDYLTQIDKAGGKPVAIKPKAKVVTVNADDRLTIP